MKNSKVFGIAGITMMLISAYMCFYSAYFSPDGRVNILAPILAILGSICNAYAFLYRNFKKK